MKVLWNIAPLIELDSPFFKLNWLTDLALRLTRANGFESRYIVNEGFVAAMDLSPIRKNVILLDQKTILKDLAENENQFLEPWYHRQATASDSRISYQLLTALGGWVPDIIISLVSFAPLQKAFPDTPVFHLEYSLFSRAPFPRSWYLDPVGMGGCAYLDAHADALRAVLEEGAALLPEARQFKESLQGVWKKTSPGAMEWFAKMRARGVVIGLIPLQLPVYVFTAESPIRSPFKYVYDCLTRLPAGHHAVVTVHPEFNAVMPEQAEFFRKHFGNVTFQEEIIPHAANATNQLLPWCDYVVNVSSSVGIQARLLFDLPVLERGRSFFTMSRSARTFEDFSPAQLSGEKVRENDLLLIWMLKHYCHFEPDMFQLGWLQERFQVLLDHFKLTKSNKAFAALPPITGNEGIFSRLSAHLGAIRSEPIIKNIPATRAALPASATAIESSESDAEAENSLRTRLKWVASVELENELLHVQVKTLKETAESAAREHQAKVAALEHTIQERSEWAQSVDVEIATARHAHATLQAEFSERTAWAHDLDRALSEIHTTLAALQSAYAESVDRVKTLELALSKASKDTVPNTVNRTVETLGS